MSQILTKRHLFLSPSPLLLFLFHPPSLSSLLPPFTSQTRHSMTKDHPSKQSKKVKSPNIQAKKNRKRKKKKRKKKKKPRQKTVLHIYPTHITPCTHAHIKYNNTASHIMDPTLEKISQTANQQRNNDR
ncbi:hypothetical protein FN846DRAFT_469669 [Sphaerosporella brunnea]|uniref:Uncharacterized protein n=1 Tax=Sphaerosporella brunnea TaxID=1250544 RepID=A0A5J5EEQ5_9PEZI|nr:hypothetical protein FN846DRAFT_469669 [Sphaerosporella brunnea]